MTWLNLHDAWTGPDKTLHFLGGLVMSLVLALAAWVLLGAEAFPAQALGWLVATLIGCGKEVWDHYHPPHQPSLQDAVVTSAGAAVGMLAAWVLMSFA